MLEVYIGLCDTTNHEEQRLEKVQEHLYTEIYCMNLKTHMLKKYIT